MRVRERCSSPGWALTLPAIGAQPEPCRIWSYQTQRALPTSLCQGRRTREWAVGRRAKVETKCCLCHFTVHFHRMVVEVDKENKTQVDENGWFSEFLVQVVPNLKFLVYLFN